MSSLWTLRRPHWSLHHEAIRETIMALKRCDSYETCANANVFDLYGLWNVQATKGVNVDLICKY